MKERVFYYSDPVNDDFAGNNIKTTELPPDYSYFPKTGARRIAAAVIYHAARPLVWLIQEIVFNEKTVGREKLKGFRKDGFYLYGNHTRAMGDAYCPGNLSWPKKAYIVAGADAFSIKGIRRLVEDLGGIALPLGKKGFKNYTLAMRRHAELNHVITLYPEAHIWPYYTKIRDFPDTSFEYPVRFGVPVYCFTNTYQERRFSKKPRIVTYIDGPFLPDESLGRREMKKELRDRVYGCMCKRAENSSVEYIKYVRRENG